MGIIKFMNTNISFNNVSFETANGFLIFKNVTIGFSNEKTALVGVNGSGKSTFLKLLVGELSVDTGVIQRQGKVAYLPQDYCLDITQTVAEALGVKEKIEALEALKLGAKEQSLIDSVQSDWDLSDRLNNIFGQLRLSNIGLNRVLNTLSGGERMKVLLAKLLLEEPDFLVLDEPSNNLDRVGREIIYDLVKTWTGGLLVVSHDRELLSLVDRVLEIRNQQIYLYGGNYEDYREQKNLLMESTQRQISSAEQSLRKIKKQAQSSQEKQNKKSERGKKNRDKAGMSKMLLDKKKDTSDRTLSKIKQVYQQRVEGAAENLKKAKENLSFEGFISMDLTATEVPAGKLVFEIKNLNFSYDDKAPLFKDFSWSVYGPTRWALQGHNGSGKTTLVNLLLKVLKPLSGSIVLGVNNIAYLDQTATVLQKDKSILENVSEYAGMDKNMARQWLSSFLFMGESDFKKAKVLSGGERIRAALACIFAATKAPQLLILDEPTNNLDLNSIEWLENALLNYQGALIVISHDQKFLENIGITENLYL